MEKFYLYRSEKSSVLPMVLILPEDNTKFYDLEGEIIEGRKFTNNRS